jgi:FixJ family two-component response regulator
LDAVREFVRENLGSTLSAGERQTLEGVARGLSEREMALEFGVAPSTVNARKRLALHKLREHLASGGHVPSEGGRGERNASSGE